MKRNTSLQMLFILTAIVGLAGLAFAHGGGFGHGMMGRGMMGDGYGSGYGMMDQGRNYGRQPQDYGYGDLSREDAARLRQARERFEASTRALRSAIHEKQDALNNELDKADPDSGNVSRLQKEISRLQSRYDQEAVEFELEKRKIIPDGARGGNYYSPGSESRRW